MHELIINFTPTGMVPTKEMTPHVPVSPAEIIEQVHEAYELGITLAHLHARRADGSPAFEKSIYAEIFDGLRRHCPDLVLCASLSGRSFAAFEQRSEVLELRPDMASLTLGSMNFAREASVNSPEMIARLAEKMDHFGVRPELECFDAGMVHYAKYLIGKGLLKPPYYFNLLLGNLATAQDDLIQTGALIHQLPAGAYWALAGIGSSQLRASTLALLEGGGVRVGLEDNLWLDTRRTRLATNLDLLRRVHQLAAVFERPVMRPAAFGALGFYNAARAARP
ncbi:MAG: 3-keto-5-aminohexanoate cleavage protein [Verrucomicrobiaceae bacterium]|nr:3-keto-5-aminohexanoate cleavage protein [Verrucomicrobiaceae bacterium]